MNGSFREVMRSYASAALSIGKRCVVSLSTGSFPWAIRSSTASMLRFAVHRAYPMG